MTIDLFNKLQYGHEYGVVFYWAGVFWLAMLTLLGLLRNCARAIVSSQKQRLWRMLAAYLSDADFNDWMAYPNPILTSQIISKDCSPQTPTQLIVAGHGSRIIAVVGQALTQQTMPQLYDGLLSTETIVDKNKSTP